MPDPAPTPPEITERRVPQHNATIAVKANAIQERDHAATGLSYGQMNDILIFFGEEHKLFKKSGKKEGQ